MGRVRRRLAAGELLPLLQVLENGKRETWELVERVTDEAVNLEHNESEYVAYL